jgi:hypothetical protein
MAKLIAMVGSMCYHPESGDPIRSTDIGTRTSTVTLPPMIRTDHFDLVEGKGVYGNNRFFNKKTKQGGLPSPRQMGIIERELLAATLSRSASLFQRELTTFRYVAIRDGDHHSRQCYR